MVQKSRTTSIASAFRIVLLRAALLAIIAILTWFSGYLFWEVIKNYIGYQTPGVFFSFVSDLIVIFGLGLTFWGGVFFGALGRWWDYLLITILTGWSLYSYSLIEENTAHMLLYLMAAALLANAIGFALKLLRQKFLPNLKV